MKQAAQCEGQLSIFDFLKSNALDDLPEEDMVQMIVAATGIDFQKRSFAGGRWIEEEYEYSGKRGGYEYTVRYSNYNMNDSHARYISCGWGRKTEGGGSPCDSVDEAIRYFKRILERQS